MCSVFDCFILSIGCVCTGGRSCVIYGASFKGETAPDSVPGARGSDHVLQGVV